MERRVKILLAEDDLDSAAAIKAALEKSGIEIAISSDGGGCSHGLPLEDRASAQSLRREHDELKALWSRFVRIQEKERGDLTRVLHDEIGQLLVALGMNLAILQSKLPKDVMQSVSKTIKDSKEQLKNLSERVRNVMAGLRPPVLDDYGLVASLRWYAEQYSTRTGIPVEVRSDADTLRLPDEVEATLFRVAQEAMTNIAKYAKAKQAFVSCVSTEEAYRLTISDDGVGFDTRSEVDRSNGRGLGLVMMREMVRSVGGQFAVKSKVGDGTQIIVEINDAVQAGRLPVVKGSQ